MGFPAVPCVLLISRLLLRFVLVLGLTKNAIWWALQCAGLSEIFEPETFSSETAAEMVREQSPVSKFGEFVQRRCEMEEDFVCSVCLNAFEEEDEIRELCNCYHMFHRNCLDKWLDYAQSTCPLCRSSLLPRVDDNHVHCEESLWAVDGISFLFAEDLVLAKRRN